MTGRIDQSVVITMEHNKPSKVALQDNLVKEKKRRKKDEFK